MVLEAGRKALEKWEARAFRRDILYAMTLAHLGLASEALKAKEQASLPLPTGPWAILAVKLLE